MIRFNVKLEKQLGDILEREKSFEGPLQQSVQDFDKCQDHAFHRFLKWLNFSHLFFCSFSSSHTHTRTISLPPSLSLVLTLSHKHFLSQFFAWKNLVQFCYELQFAKGKKNFKFDLKRQKFFFMKSIFLEAEAEGSKSVNILMPGCQTSLSTFVDELTLTIWNAWVSQNWGLHAWPQ